MLQEKSITEIMESLQQEGISVCRQTVWRFQNYCHEHQRIAPLQRSGRPTKLTERVLQAIESAMQNDSSCRAWLALAANRSFCVSTHNSERAKGTWFDLL